MASSAALTRVLHADLFGRAKSKLFPNDTLPSDGIGYCRVSMAETLAGEPLTGADFSADRGHPDMLAIPDQATTRPVPWESDMSWMVADLVDFATGAEHTVPSDLCQRSVVRVAEAALAELGLSAQVATEPEFYIVTPEQGLYSDVDGMVYTAGRRADPLGMIALLQRHLLGLGLPISAGNREFSPGQFEINLVHTAPLASADDTFLFKEAVKEIVSLQGLQATFMARPFQAHSGSSMHLHVSLWRDGRNAFAEDPTLMAHFTAGLVAHSAALTAIASSTINSYKRLNGGGVVAQRASVGDDNREAWIRQPAERGSATRLELRGGDAASNPYLLIASALHAGVDGVQRRLTLPDTPPPLPSTLKAAIDALVKDAALVGGLGEELVGIYAALKRDESDQYDRTVTDWEWRAYSQHA